MAEKKSAAPQGGVRLIVRRGALRRFDRLTRETEGLPVVIGWDRRKSDRRTKSGAASAEERRAERRKEPPFTWSVADFVVVDSEDAPAPDAAKKAAPRRKSDKDK